MELLFNRREFLELLSISTINWSVNVAPVHFIDGYIVSGCVSPPWTSVYQTKSPDDNIDGVSLYIPQAIRRVLAPFGDKIKILYNEDKLTIKSNSLVAEVPLVKEKPSWDAIKKNEKVDISKIIWDPTTILLPGEILSILSGDVSLSVEGKDRIILGAVSPVDNVNLFWDSGEECPEELRGMKLLVSSDLRRLANLISKTPYVSIFRYRDRIVLYIHKYPDPFKEPLVGFFVWPS